MKPIAHSNFIQFQNKFYGREEELAILQEAFQLASFGSTEFVLITGQSGIGKSVLILDAFKPTVMGKCYFASGKFEQYNDSIPYGAFITCFRHVINQLLTEPDAILQKYVQKVQEAVGTNGSVITNVIPEARILLGELPSSEELPPAEALNRFELVFQRFVHVFAQIDYPLVLFFDDIQWADEASLQLLQTLITNPISQNLLVITARREPIGEQNLGLFEQWIQGNHSGYSVHEISMSPLHFDQIHTMLADSLQCTFEHCRPLAHLLYIKSIGNPFHYKQLVKSALSEQAICYNSLDSKWEWDMEALGQLPEIEGQLDYLIVQLNKVPVQSKHLLIYAACLGNTFEIQALCAISGSRVDEIHRNLTIAIETGLLTIEEELSTRIQYRFTHDRIQQAAYSSLDQVLRMNIHLLAGRYFYSKWKKCQQDHLLFHTVNHFNQVTKLLSEEELQLSVKLNEQAGKKAMQYSSYSKALQYFTKAIECLTDDFQNRHFDFTFELYLKNAECSYLCGFYEQAESQLKHLLKQAKTWSQQAQVYKLKITQYSNIGKYSQAIELGLKALKEVEVHISVSPNKIVILKELLQTKKILDKRMKELPSILDIHNPQAKIMMELLISLVAPTFFSNREVFVVIVSKFIRFVFKHGSSTVAPVLYASYGMLLGTILGQYRMGYQLGKIAVDMADQSNIPSVKSKVYVMFYSVISPWVRYEEEDEVKLVEAAKLGLESGDYVYASYAVGGLSNLSYVRDSMSKLNKKLSENLQVIEHTKEDLVYKNVLIYLDMAKRLQSPEGDVFTITDGRLNEADFMEELMKDESKDVTLYQIFTYKTQIYYLFGHYQEAVNFAEKANQYEALSVHAPHFSEHHFYEALSIAAIWNDLTLSEKAIYGRRLRRRYYQFKKWAKMSPENFRYKLLLIQAEIMKLKGLEPKTIELYDQAIASARKKNMFRYLAVACERAAIYHLQKNRIRMTSVYLHEAYDAYEIWGLEAKRKQLRKQFPDWLQESQKIKESVQIKSANDALSYKEKDKADHTVTEDVARIDLGSIIKETFNLSHDIDLKEIIEKLMMIIKQTSNAEKVRLIVQKNGDLWVYTGFDTDGSLIDSSCELNKSDNVPISLIKYISRMGKALQTVDASKDDLFQSDSYIIKNQCIFICGIPLFAQEQFAGILYLENNSAAQAFTEDSIDTLGILASQALFILKLTDSFGNITVKGPSTNDKKQEQEIDALTDRELEVLNLMAKGMTNKEIAIELGVTAGTVKVHSHNIFSKLNVNRRTKAVAEAIKLNLLE